MGLASGTNLGEAVKLCVFDLRRGQNEGQEPEKILFFYPSDLPFSDQLSVIGLSEGLITFTRIFSPEAACEVIEAEMHSHVFYEPEPDIWMVMVIEKNDSEAIWQINGVRNILKEVHSLFVMFFGCIRSLVDEEPSGGIVRTHLYYFIMDFLSDLFVGRNLQLPNFRNSLKESRTVQMLTVGREVAIEVQSLVRLLESCAGNARCYSLTMFQDLMVSTTLSPVDTACVFAYATSRLTPLALSSEARSWSYSNRGNTACNTLSGAVLEHSDPVMEHYYNSHDTCPAGNRKYHVVRPLQHGKWSKGKNGFLVTDIWGVDTGSAAAKTPTILLHQTEEKMYLISYQHRGLTVILLVPVLSILDGERGIALVKQQILENASLKMFRVEEKLSRGWGGENAYHVSGYRYLIVDSDRYLSRASPPGKVTTLTKESLVALSKLREEVDLQKNRAKWDNLTCEKELEVCIRAKNNAWLIARIIRGKELYMVLEKSNEALLSASDSVETFSERYCDGVFSSG